VRNFSIRAKLIGIVMTTTLVALSLAGGALALFQLRSDRDTLAKELETMADIVGQNLAAPLILERADSAQTALEALAGQPDVISACLYGSDGQLFASYSRGPQPCPEAPAPAEVGFTGGSLILHHQVAVSGESPATLRLVASQGELEQRMRLFALVLLAVLSGSALAALGISSWLQRLVSRPVLELASTARRISRESDYTLRAPQHSQDEVGVAVGAFNTMLDRIEAAVSERKRAESELLALNATLEQRVAERTAAAEQKATELKRSNEELERFAAVASHDLQEPLRAVASYSQLVQARLDSSLDDETRLYFSHVNRGVGRMKSLITDLLDYARVGRGAPPRSRVDLAAVLDTALADLAPTLADSHTEIVRHPLPPVWGDAGQLGQLLRNLLTNAIHFQGADPPRIEVSAERQGELWKISVKDNGIGIEGRHHDRVFQMFQRLHGRDRPGTGIGLAICRKIVELHGGHIWVESEVGRGADFLFTLPPAAE
jgi:signal transduction histidine kinase